MTPERLECTRGEDALVPLDFKGDGAVVEPAAYGIRQRVSEYVSVCQHMSAYVSVCQHASACVSTHRGWRDGRTCSIRQLCQRMSKYVSVCQGT
jgi:hypothetical protein